MDELLTYVLLFGSVIEVLIFSLAVNYMLKKDRHSSFQDGMLHFTSQSGWYKH